MVNYVRVPYHYKFKVKPNELLNRQR